MYDDQCDNTKVLFVMVIGPGDWSTMSTIQEEVLLAIQIGPRAVLINRINDNFPACRPPQASNVFN